MAEGIGILVQRLQRQKDRVLVVAHIVGGRTAEPWSRPVEIKNMFEALRVPEPGNMSQELARLAADGLMRSRSDRTWSVTPMGEELVYGLIGSLDSPEVAADLQRSGVALFDHVEHPLIPPELAPWRFRPAIERVLSISPFERNVFLMTRFPPPDAPPTHPLAQSIEAVHAAIEGTGLTLHVASDRQADDQVFGNVGAHLWACKFGIALLEATDIERNPGNLNDNVLIEIGAMLVSGRRCALLKDRSAPSLPTDFVAEIYKEIDISQPAGIRAAVADWVRQDLGIRTM